MRDTELGGFSASPPRSVQLQPSSAAPAPFALTGARPYDLYGPTEAAADVAFHEVAGTDTLSVPIGAPVFDTGLYVLDPRLRPIPVGAPGELYLSGVQLARGYLARPEPTAERFAADSFGGPDVPASAEYRMCRTGGLVRWMPHGEPEYFESSAFPGRPRGSRNEIEIEAVPGRVEAVLGRVVAVVGRGDALVGRVDALVGRVGALVGRGDAVLGRVDVVLDRVDALVGRGGALVGPGEAVLGRGDAALGRGDAVFGGGDAVVVLLEDAGVGVRLTAYVVAARPGAVRPDRLWAALAEALPGYLAPAAYVVLGTLPVTPSGELDRRALPGLGRASAEYTAPVTAAEREGARVFAEVRGNKPVGRNDDLFALGGKRPVAPRVAARRSADPNCPLGVRDARAACTVAELAGLVERAGGSGGASMVAQLRARPRPPLVPLSPARRRIRSCDRFDDAEAIAFELPELSVATSTLDIGVTELDPQLTVTEDSAGAGLGEGSASAGVPVEFTPATPAAKLVAAASGALLGVDRAGPDDDPFARVGDSRTPARVGDLRTPARVGDSRTPARVGDSRTPARVGDSRTPARVGDSRTPARVGDSRTPARVGDLRTPARVGDSFTAARVVARRGARSPGRALFEAPTLTLRGSRSAQAPAAGAADPAVGVGDIQPLGAEERPRAPHQRADGGPGVADAGGNLAERFTSAAALDPAAVAVRDGTRSLTYAELDDWSNRLARRLIAAGVGPERLVAIALPRSAELVVALLAVLKAGGGYLPIDPAYPGDRIEYVLDDARPICALAGGATELPRGWFGGPVIDVDAPNLPEFDGGPVIDADRRAPLRCAHVAYVIYTSGSTGKPKGVVVPHRNVLRLLDSARSIFGFGPADVWALFHSYAFDFSVWELWAPLLSGATVVVVDHHTARSPRRLRELLIAERVTVLSQTPSAFYRFAAADLAEPAPAGFALRTVVFGGEALEPQRLAGWLARYPDAPRLVNMYGITETTVHVSHRTIDGRTGPASVIGAALPGLTVRLLDDRLRPVPVGVPGEIYVSGGQLARGYLHRPALTAARFVADPYSGDGSLAYRSGDVARWTPDGDLEYLGRADQQVNLRGFRVELGEIEVALLEASAAVREVAVMVRADLVEEARIVAYVVSAEESIDAAALRRAVGYRLPEHMVPAAIVPVPRIPLTVNGKLDRAALTAPRFEPSVHQALCAGHPGADRAAAARTVAMADLPALVARAAKADLTARAFEHNDRVVSFGELDARLTGVAETMGAAVDSEALLRVALAGLAPGLLAAPSGSDFAALLRTVAATAEALLADPGSALDSEGNR
nr:amino acid adenylation domain-containing protein [Nocardia asiatica]